MYDIIVGYMLGLVPIVLPLIALRVTFDWFSTLVFGKGFQMDKLYIGEIPSSYCYAIFNNGYIDLYQVGELHANNTYHYYRVYLYDNVFLYTQGENVRGQYTQTQYLQEIPVSNDVVYRRDFPMIILTCFIYLIIGLWVFNFMTSMVKKGGLLNGLL